MTGSMPFDAYSTYYDLLYRDKDYVSEVDYVNELLISRGLNVCDILEFGSGTGKHGRLLANYGYKVFGIELSPEMVSLADQTEGFVCQQGDICSVQLGRTFDAVLSLFHVISYQVTNQSVKAVFSRAAEHLSPGGLFIFDVWYSPAVHNHRPSVRVKRMKDEAICITRIAEPLLRPNDNIVDVKYSIFVEDISSGLIQTFSELHPMRHFSLPEIDLFAEYSGFERLSAETFMSGAPVSEDTWAICLVLRKL